MELRASPPFVVGSLRWQDAPDAWTMTIVVKLTLTLKAGLMTVAREQEPIRERDLRRGSDPDGRVNAPCDLVPFKAGAEFIVVGQGPSTSGSQTGRLVVGGVEKVLDVGALEHGPIGARLGPAETKWPLGADGRQHVTMAFVPTPIIDVPLGVEIERDYFHAAPPDQQLPELRGDESLVLEHLHPKLSYLSTRLPGVRPRARVEIDGMQPWEVDLSADTLWIDVDRSIGAVVFRGLLPLAGREQEGLVSIGVEHPGEEVVFPEAPQARDKHAHLAWPPSPPPPPPPRLSRARTEPPPSKSPPSSDEDEREQTQPNAYRLLETGTAPVPTVVGTALPFTSSRDAPAQIASRPPETESEQTSVFTVPALRARTPTWLGGTEVPRPPEPPSRPSTFGGMPGQTLPTSAAFPADLLRRATPVPFPAPSMEPSRAPAYGQINAPAPVASRSSTTSIPPPNQPPPPPRPSSAGMPALHQPPPPPRPSSAGMPALHQPPPPPRPSSAGMPSAPKPPPPVAQILRPPETIPAPSLTDASNRAAHDHVLVPAPPALTEGSTIGQSLFGGSTIGQGTIGQGTIGQGTIGQGTIGQSSSLQGVEPRFAATPAASSPTGRASEDPPRRRVDGRSLANAAILGVAEASTAAALAADAASKETARPAKPGIPVSPAAAPPPPRALVDFLWYAPELTPRLRERDDWKRLLDEGEKPPPPPEEEVVPDEELPPDAPPRKKRKPPPPPPEKTPEERARGERAHVTRVLVRGEPTQDVESALFTAIDAEGALAPPLVLVSGEVELPFDETETLRVLVGAAQSLSSVDRKLKETVDLAQDALGTPLVSSPDVAASFSARIRDAWQKANRVLSADYLDVHTRRILLEQRRYQIREILGAQWIRGLFHGSGSSALVPVYVPQELSKRLPLFVKFPARLVVEVLPAQDQNETLPVALRALALARVIAAGPLRP